MRLTPHHVSGQSLVEFALSATLLITLMFGVIDFGRAYYTQVRLKNAIAEGGYYAMQHANDDAGIKQAIEQEFPAIAAIPSEYGPGKPNTIAISRTPCIDGNQQTTVIVTYQHHLLFTFLISSMTVTLSGVTIVPQIAVPYGC